MCECVRVLFLCVLGDFYSVCLFVCIYLCVYMLGRFRLCVFLTASPSVCVDPSVLSVVFEYICLPLWSLCLAVCVFVIVCVFPSAWALVCRLSLCFVCVFVSVCLSVSVCVSERLSVGLSAPCVCLSDCFFLSVRVCICLYLHLRPSPRKLQSIETTLTVSGCGWRFWVSLVLGSCKHRCFHGGFGQAPSQEKLELDIFIFWCQLTVEAEERRRRYCQLKNCNLLMN